MTTTTETHNQRAAEASYAALVAGPPQVASLSSIERPHSERVIVGRLGLHMSVPAPPPDPAKTHGRRE